MTNATEALDIIKALSPSLNIEWINTGRESEDWKCKIYRQTTSGYQFAVYNRKKSILVLIERASTVASGVVLVPIRPKSHALGHSESRFSGENGYCYEVSDASAFRTLLLAYLV